MSYVKLLTLLLATLPEPEEPTIMVIADDARASANQRLPLYTLTRAPVVGAPPSNRDQLQQLVTRTAKRRRSRQTHRGKR